MIACAIHEIESQNNDLMKKIGKFYWNFQSPEKKFQSPEKNFNLMIVLLISWKKTFNLVKFDLMIITLNNHYPKSPC
jgi:hypothetical protein